MSEPMEVLIRQSDWWTQAVETPDRHYPVEQNVSLADLLEAVHGMLARLLVADPPSQYFETLRQSLTSYGLELSETF